MKKLILFALSAMAGVSGLQAQTFRPFCEEGKTWKSDSYMLTHPNPFSTWTVETWKMEGDTLIGSQTCKKLFVDGGYCGALYDEGARTFIVPKGSEEAVLLYDFSLEAGGTASVYSDYGQTASIKASGTGSLEYDGRTLRTVSFESNAEGPTGCTWIEGVGSTVSPLHTWSDPTLTGGRGGSIRCCATADGALWFNEWHGLPYAADNEFEEYTMIPFCEEGKLWYVDEPSSSDGLTVYTMTGDTLIGGHVAKCMFRAGIYAGAFYDEAYLTYFIAPGEATAHLAYNFGLRHYMPTRVWNGSVWCQLVTDDYAGYDYAGIPRNATKMYFLEVEDGGRTAAEYPLEELLKQSAGMWVEGLGSLNGPLENCGMPGDVSATRLRACCTPSRILYDPDGILGISAPTLGTAESVRYSLDGRRADGNTRGIVIENGQKVLK